MKIRRFGLQGFLVLVCAFTFCDAASAIQTVKTFETGTFTGTTTLGVTACFTGTFLYAAGDEDIVGVDYSASTPGGSPGTVTLDCVAESPTKTIISGTFSTTDGKVVGEIHGSCTTPDWTFGCDFGDVIVCSQQLVFDCPGCTLDPAFPAGLTFPEQEATGTISTPGTGNTTCAMTGPFTSTVIETSEAESDAALPENTVSPGTLIADPETTAGGVDYSIDIPAGGSGDLSAAYVTIPLSAATDGDNDPPPGFGVSTDPAQFWDINFTGSFDSLTMTLGYDDTGFACTAGACAISGSACGTALDCEASQVIYHYTGTAGGWQVIVPDSIDTSLNTITFTTTSLSLHTAGAPVVGVPALSNRGLVFFLVLAAGALTAIRRRRSRSVSG